ncbi:hypothetical protein B0J13DRAFT_453613 [Dactylonectria estremocensis]|uniref:Uncharacterized protein n=1 Tax=Dactylonectria estremocensis TaxID=1079267 RepID=A0A9P9DWV4_9HYPO|nr:hypothetical protein B0J13DRAFT_453613 [Dactylonectria estremocensis]
MVGTWKLDQSCEQYLDTIQWAFADAQTLAEHAQAALEGALKPRPKNRKGNIKNWDRVARSIKVMFGFLPDSKNGNKKKDENWEQVFQVFDLMVKGLQGEALRHGKRDPIIVCNDKVWGWFGPDEVDPTLPDDITEGNKMKDRYPKKFAKGYVGAYYWNGRWDWRKKKNADAPASACDEESTALAETAPGLDMMQLCERFFKPEFSKRKVIPALQTTETDDSLHNLGDPATTLVHELAHWYGATKGRVPVPDQTCRDQDGKFIYKDKTTGEEVLLSEPPKAPQTESCRERRSTDSISDGFKHLQNLSLKGGPKESTRTADAYSVFSMMAFLNKWDWSQDGKARGIKYEAGAPS